MNCIVADRTVHKCEIEGLISVVPFSMIPTRLLHSAAVAIVQLLIVAGIVGPSIFSSRCIAEQIDSNQFVFHYDAGPSGSSVEAGVVELNLETAYTSEKGFGWTQGPLKGFSRRELSRSRNSMKIDGVSGPRLGFQADIVPGSWSLFLWVESGLEDASSLKLSIQGRERTLGWQAFRSPEEPRHEIQETYRVYQGTAEVSSEGFSFELIGGQDEVHLLGFSLIRSIDSLTEEHRRLMKQLSSAGRYSSAESLDDLSKQVDQELLKDRIDPFYALWKERLELLTLADRYFVMRGWEWANQETGLGIFDRLEQSVMLLDGFLSADTEQARPLTDRALFIRGRILYWLGEQASGTGEIAGGQRDLKKLYARYPDDKLLAMYTGETIDLPDECDCLEKTSDAPAWSVAQREALCRLRQIAHWWVEERQADNGEFGGKFGDDVEMLRWWAPLVLSGDEIAQRGWQKLANGVWESRHIHEGYARKVADVEHASEFISDTASMMAIFSDAPRFVDRLAYSAEHFENVWTGTTTKEHRFFRSAWFSSTAVATEEPKDRDLEFNSRAVKAIRYLMLRRPDPKVIKLLHEWSLAWVSAALRTDKGKPKGIIPASVRFTDEAFNGDEPSWYRANMYWDYFEWEHYAGSMMLDQLCFTYLLTKDEQLLQPMFLALDLIRSEEENVTGNEGASNKEGSRAWVASNLLRSGLFWSVVEQWRFFSGDSRWDDLILRHGTDYGRYRLSGDEHHLVAGLNRLLERVRYNTPMKTTEAIHTDRVYAPGSDHLKAMLTGDGVEQSSSPYFSVSWEQTDEDFTALVSETGRELLKVRLYSHSLDERQVVMRLWQLTPGEYQLRLEPQGQQPQEKSITVHERGQRVQLTLPARRLLRVSLEPTP